MIITSHFAAVLPLFLKDGEITTTLVLYKNKYNPRNPLEYRLIGGSSEGDELPWQTASRELLQEAGLLSQDQSARGFLQVGEPEERPDESGEGLHLKFCFVCINPCFVPHEQIREMDVEGTIDISLETLIAHLTREFPLPGGHRVRNRFHQKSIKTAVQAVAKGLPRLEEICKEYGW